MHNTVQMRPENYGQKVVVATGIVCHRHSFVAGSGQKPPTTTPPPTTLFPPNHKTTVAVAAAAL